MGKTRNAIVGKWHRLDITAPYSPNLCDRKFLHKLWVGGYTPAQIAEKMNIPEVTVATHIRKMKRHNERMASDRNPRRMAAGLTGPARVRRSGPAKFVEVVEAPAVERDEEGRAVGKVSFFDLKSDQCRFIPGEAAAEHTLYCGDPVIPDTSYCAYHLRITHTAMRSPRQKEVAWMALAEARKGKRESMLREIRAAALSPDGAAA